MIYEKIIVWTDTHKYAGNASKEQPTVADAGDSRVFLLGDNIDFANCNPKDLDKAERDFTSLQLAFGDRYLMGNHERLSCYPRYILIDTYSGRAVLSHGDWESWGEAKTIAYRMKPHGASWFKRTFVVGAIEEFERVFDRKYKDEFILRARQLMQRTDAKYFCCGHLHPHERVEIKVDEGVIYILPRGRSEVVF